MNSLLTGDLISRIDRFIAKYLIFAVISVLATSALASIVITLIRIKEYSGYRLCTDSPKCYSFFGSIISPQVEIIKSGAAVASLIVLITGAYLAIRTYLSTSQVGMLGNAIAHVTFFERFINSEITRRQRLDAKNLDIFAIYELMFPRSNANQRFADIVFVDAVQRIFDVINESSRRYSSRKNEFKFDDHRRRMIEAFGLVHISMNYSPRIDFLETEDEALDFLVIVCRVFAPPGKVISPPVRTYR